MPTLLLAQSDTLSKGKYYKSFPRQLTGRTYLSKKYTDFLLKAADNTQDIKYRPNNAFNLGVGATYRAFTLNLGFNLGFLDDNRGSRGKTKFLDLQTHVYPRNWLIDFYGQFYKGYFLNKKGIAVQDPGSYYLRPDMNVQVIGVSVFRMLQPHKLSYRAAFLQTEWQKKSAGSWLLGWEVYAGRVKSDSAFIPSVLSYQFEHGPIRQISFLEFGPGAGYAYTWVWLQNFFVTASATINGDLSFVSERDGMSTTKKTNFSPNITGRAVVGFNSDRWGIGLSWVHNSINLRSEKAGNAYLLNTGNIRFSIAKRFKPGKRLERVVPDL